MQVWNTIRATVGSGQAVLLTSHSMAEVLMLVLMLMLMLMLMLIFMLMLI